MPEIRAADGIILFARQASGRPVSRKCRYGHRNEIFFGFLGLTGLHPQNRAHKGTPRYAT